MEQVLVIKREDIGSDKLKQGFMPSNDNQLYLPLDKIFFIDRDKAENDPTYKQLIPQMVLRRKNGDIFLVQRLKTQGEARLHGRHSIGIGGHINPIDRESGLADIFHSGMIRELYEEILISGSLHWDTEFLGVMNDDSDDVGKVHYAVVYMLTLDDDCNAEINEKDKMIGGFVTIKEAAKHYNNMEKWSQIIFDYITKGKQSEKKNN